MTRFLLIRHAITDAVGKVLSGRMPGFHLNKEGQLQAENLAKRLAGLSIEAIYSSPLERAIETAAPIARLLHLQPAICAGLTELNFGTWTNCAIDEIKHQPQFQHFNSFRSHARIPGGESMPEAQLRIIESIEKLCIRHADKTVIIISHADLIKAAIAYYAGIHLDMFQRIQINPASISTIDIYDDTASIIAINDTGKING